MVANEACPSQTGDYLAVSIVGAEALHGSLILGANRRRSARFRTAIRSNQSTLKICFVYDDPIGALHLIPTSKTTVARP